MADLIARSGADNETQILSSLKYKSLKAQNLDLGQSLRTINSTYPSDIQAKLPELMNKGFSTSDIDQE